MKMNLEILRELAIKNDCQVSIKARHNKWMIFIERHTKDTACFDHNDLSKNIDDAIKFLTEIDES